MTKYIFVTGGVVSGLGKGITAASLGRLLKSRGLKVAAQKLDPYINVDPGTMSPFQHGEVFVTEDGAETDLDLGHYERFIDEDLNQFSNLTTGKVYWNVLNKERAGEYLGETVQVIPHITGEIKSFIYGVGQKTGADVVITEIGGTTGDIESQPFLEAIRQVAAEVGRRNCLFLHVTLVPFISGSDEPKSKPTQHSVKELRGMGIQPDLIICRVDRPLDEDIKAKISLFCNVAPDCVIENRTVPELYRAPLMLERSHLSDIVCRELGLDVPAPDLGEWTEMLARMDARDGRVKIALVGKYVKLHDAYLSVAEALHHAGYEVGCFVDIDWVDSEAITDDTAGQLLAGADGIILPGGFGSRGIEGHAVRSKLRPQAWHSLFRHLSGHADRRHVLRPRCTGLAGRALDRVRPRHRPSGHRPDERAAGSHPEGWHHAPRRLSLPRFTRFHPVARLRGRGNTGTSPPPLRVQQHLP